MKMANISVAVPADVPTSVSASLAVAEESVDNPVEEGLQVPP